MPLMGKSPPLAERAQIGVFVALGQAGDVEDVPAGQGDQVLGELV